MTTDVSILRPRRRTSIGLGYWFATIAVTAELAVGGIWDITRIRVVTTVVTRLGYPTYFLVLLGIWKELAAMAVIVPGRPLVKEWAYAGVFFVYSGAIFSHVATGYGLSEVPVLLVMLFLTVASWTLRPQSRRVEVLTWPAPSRFRSPRLAHTLLTRGRHTRARNDPR
jgi:DoxX-like family